MCNHDKWEEACFEDHAFGTYIDSRLVSYVPIEQSFLFSKFIEKTNNQLFAEVNGGRKLENHVSCIYHVIWNKKHFQIFSEETNKLKKKKSDT